MIPIVYVFNHKALHEPDEMALATLEGLRDEFQPFILAPDGPLLDAARNQGMFAIPFGSATDFALKLGLLLASNEELAFVATSRANSTAMRMINLFFRRRATHLQIVEACETAEGLIDEIGLERDEVLFVTRSDMVRERLAAKHPRHDRIRVVEGFLSPARLAALRPRLPFTEDGVRRIFVSCPNDEQSVASFTNLLSGGSVPPFLNYLVRTASENRESLREQLRATPGASLVPAGMGTAGLVASSDLLLRLGDSDFVDTVTLEALATGVPVLTGTVDGRPSPISDGVNGFCYRLGDADDLAGQLRRLASISFDQLNAVAKGGRYLVDIRYSANSGVDRFRRLFAQSRAPVPEFNGGKLIL